MCFVCGDPVQTQKEVVLVVNSVTTLSSVPILAIVIWQIKNLFKSIQEFNANILSRLRKKNR